MTDLMEDIYVLYNNKTQSLYRAQNWSYGKPIMELKTWKTLNGAVKALSNLKNSNKGNNLEIKKLSIKGINE